MSWVSKIKGGKKTKPVSTKMAPRVKPAAQQTASRSRAAPAPKADAQADNPQKRQVVELAHAIFQISALEQKNYENKEARIAGWRDTRPQYLRMARKVIRCLEKRGIQLSGPAAPASPD